MKKWLIIYDIHDKKRLVKVMKLINQYAERVQLSVYELEADITLIDKIKSELENIIKPKSDSVVFFDICADDWAKREKFGKISGLKPEQSFYII